MSEKSLKILFYISTPKIDGFWTADDFSLLIDHLQSIKIKKNPLCTLDVKHKGDESGSILLNIDQSDYDELWLIALDEGDGLSDEEALAIERFYKEKGRGVLTARGHQDMGISLLKLSDIGKVNYFHSKNQEPDRARHRVDDPSSSDVLWPNYHSGYNGEVQKIIPVGPVHQLLKIPGDHHTRIQYLPTHQFEGAVGVADNVKMARAFMIGKSRITNKSFNIAVSLDSLDAEHSPRKGRVLCQSSFRHFTNPNWDPQMKMPYKIKEKKNDLISQHESALSDIKQYVVNAAVWLAPLEKRALFQQNL